MKYTGTVRILNSAMMPCDGQYKKETITAEQFKKEVLDNPTFVSYVGYPENCELLSKFTGVNIPLSREETVIQNGDILLVAKLRYGAGRVYPNKKNEKREIKLLDLEFSKIEYKV